MTFRKSDSGLSTVVGAILILALIISVAAVVKLTYIPDVKKEAESEHMQHVIDGIYEFKSQVDTMQAASSSGNAYSSTSRIEMGGGAVPGLDPSLSSGTLTVDPAYGTFSITAKYYNGTRAATRGTAPMGRLIYSSNNHYYVDQNVQYEGGMVLLSQQSGRVMLASPPVTISRDPNDISRPVIAINPPRINGSPQTVGSTGESTVKSTVLPVSNVLNAMNVTMVNITVQSDNAQQWYDYFGQIMAASGLANNTNYKLTINQKTVNLNVTGSGWRDDIELYSVDSLVLTQLDGASPQTQPLPPLPSVTPTPTANPSASPSPSISPSPSPSPSSSPTPTPSPTPKVNINPYMNTSLISYSSSGNTNTYRVMVTAMVSDLSTVTPANNVSVNMDTITGTPNGQLDSYTLISSPSTNPQQIMPLRACSYIWVYDLKAKNNLNNVTFNATVSGDNIVSMPPISTTYTPRQPVLTYSNYTTAGTYTFTVPAGLTSLNVTLIGGGGGGGGGNYGASMYQYGGSGGGGGSGYMTTKTNLAVTPGQAITVTVGAGGAGGAPVYSGNGNGGGTGGTSSFGMANTASGGGGGSGGADSKDTGGTGLGGVGGTGYNNGTAGGNGPSSSAGGAGGAGYLGYGAGGTGGSSSPTNGSSGMSGAVLITYTA
ncbi:MAG TPA: hypothetical protein VK436_09585 [Methanocella sp.]|nr:hypothetical protein [Methanocella sp.]